MRSSWRGGAPAPGPWPPDQVPRGRRSAGGSSASSRHRLGAWWTRRLFDTGVTEAGDLGEERAQLGRDGLEAIVEPAVALGERQYMGAPGDAIEVAQADRHLGSRIRSEALEDPDPLCQVPHAVGEELPAHSDAFA